MKKRGIALLLALTMAVSLLAGCTKKTETPVQPEQGQTEQEPTPSDETQTEPVTPQEPDQPDEPTPSEEDKPDEPQPEEPEIELTPEQKRRREIETRVSETEITARDKDFANPFVEEAVRYQLTQYLYDNWDSEALPVATYFEDDDFRLNIYQNSLEAYTCALTRTDSFDERYVRVTANGAEAITPATTAAKEASVSAEVSDLVGGAKFDKRYDGYYFDDKMDKKTNEAFRNYASQAIYAFKTTLEAFKNEWSVVLDDAFRSTITFDENDQFVFELQGKTTYWLELRYQPAYGMWSDISLVPSLEDDWDDWKLDEEKLTDNYLLSLVTTLEIGMTSAPFEFSKVKDLTQEQLWLMFLLLTPSHELEATYKSSDKMYHVTQEMMDATLSNYLDGYTLDISKDADYDAASGEIVVPMVSGFGGWISYKLRDKSVDGNTVTFTVDYGAGDDLELTSPEYAKTYTITFHRGSYFYDSAVEAPLA